MPEESTTPDPVEQIRRSGEAAQRGDLDAATTIFAPEAIWESSRNGVGTFEGAAAIRAFWGDWFGAYEELQFDFEELLEVGRDVVFSVIRQTVRPVGTTGYVRERDGLVWLWVDGLCASVTVYPEAQIDEARAAAERLAKERG
jgi:ketosteroid isomerase-like protein